MRRSGRGRPSPMRRAIDQILRLAPSIRPPMLPVVSRTKATSTRGAAARTTDVTAVTRAGVIGRSAGTAGAATRNSKGIKACMVDLRDRYRPGHGLIPDRSFIDPPPCPSPRRGRETLLSRTAPLLHCPPTRAFTELGGGRNLVGDGRAHRRQRRPGRVLRRLDVGGLCW